MTTVAYIANEFPSPLEPYVMDEVNELRRRGVKCHLLQRQASRTERAEPCRTRLLERDALLPAALRRSTDASDAAAGLRSP